MTTAPKDVTGRDAVKAVAVAVEARARLSYDRALLYLHKRNVKRQAILTKWLWHKLFEQLQRELAAPKRDIKKVAALVHSMRQLIPPPPGKNDRQVGFGDQIAASFADAFQRARQESAEQMAADAIAEKIGDPADFMRRGEAEVAENESAGDPTDVGTEEDPDGLAAAQKRWTERLGSPDPYPYGKPGSRPYDPFA